MKPALLYRVASVFLILFAAGHTLGFRQVDPKWGIGSLIQSMQSMHFRANGVERTYWDFYVGFGLFVTALLLLAAAFSWQLGGLPAATLAGMRLSAWSLVLCFGFVVFLSWRYFFPAPVIFSMVILVCLALAAWLSGNSR